MLDLALSSDVVKSVQCSLILVAVFFSTLLLYSMKNKENVVDSVVKVTINHTSESKQRYSSVPKTSAFSIQNDQFK